jgi:alpha-tubulin suppressor-like RCC1 family protein
LPVAVLGGLRFRNVTAGGAHTCGVTTDDRVYCWGWNFSGQLGVGTDRGPEICGYDACSTRPVAVAGGLRFRSVSAGDYYTCGVTTGDRAYCWGDNMEGQLGNGTTTTTLSPVPVAGGRAFRQVDAGGNHTCGVTTSNAAFCWGWNRYGQLGDSTEVARRLRPSRVAGGRQFRQLDAAQFHTCAVTTTNRAYCWGSGREGQLGNGKTYLSFWPRAVAGGLYFKRVSTGVFHSCGQTTTNRAYCWGDPWLGDGTTEQRLKPVAVTGGLLFSQLDAGGQHTCGKTAAAEAYCWGDNTYGQLGDGTIETRLTPTPVAGPL